MNLDGIDTSKELLIFVKVWVVDAMEGERASATSALAGKFLRVFHVGGDRFTSDTMRKPIWLITNLNGHTTNSEEEAVILGIYNGSELLSQEEKNIYDMIYPGLGIALACGHIL